MHFLTSRSLVSLFLVTAILAGACASAAEQETVESDNGLEVAATDQAENDPGPAAADEQPGTNITVTDARCNNRITGEEVRACAIPAPVTAWLSDDGRFRVEIVWELPPNPSPDDGLTLSLSSPDGPTLLECTTGSECVASTGAGLVRWEADFSTASRSVAGVVIFDGVPLVASDRVVSMELPSGEAPDGTAVDGGVFELDSIVLYGQQGDVRSATALDLADFRLVGP